MVMIFQNGCVETNQLTTALIKMAKTAPNATQAIGDFITQLITIPVKSVTLQDALNVKQ